MSDAIRRVCKGRNTRGPDISNCVGPFNSTRQFTTSQRDLTEHQYHHVKPLNSSPIYKTLRYPWVLLGATQTEHQYYLHEPTTIPDQRYNETLITSRRCALYCYHT